MAALCPAADLGVVEHTRTGGLHTLTAGRGAAGGGRGGARETPTLTAGRGAEGGEGRGGAGRGDYIRGEPTWVEGTLHKWQIMRES